MSHKFHYRLTCPTCRAVVESCGCSTAWHNSFPARIPCRECTLKIAIIKNAHDPNNVRPGRKAS